MQSARKFSADLGATSEKSCDDKDHKWVNCVSAQFFRITMTLKENKKYQNSKACQLSHHIFRVSLVQNMVIPQKPSFQ